MLTKQQAERNVKLYYWFVLFQDAWFWGPILITYIQRVSGMTLSEIYFMESACVLVAILLNVPTGALADLYGRKSMIVLGVGLLLLMAIMFAMADSRLMIWLANIVCFAGVSVVHGADSAFLVDTLKFLGRDHDRHKILGRSTSYRLGVVALCSIAAGYLAEANIRFPMYACIPPLMICFAITFFFKEPPLEKRSGVGLKTYLSSMKGALIFAIRDSRIRWIIAITVVVGIVSKLWFFTYNPYFELVGLPLKSFGWIFFGLNVVAAASSYFSHSLTVRLGHEKSIILVMACLALPILLMGGVVSQAAASLVMVQNFVRGYFQPFIGDLFHKYVDSSNRATVGSIKGSINDLFVMVTLAGFGALTGFWSLPSALLFLGTATLILGVALWISYRRIFVVKT